LSLLNLPYSFETTAPNRIMSLINKLYIPTNCIDFCAYWYYQSFAMTTITCKIPDDLNERLEAEASRKLLPKSALVREALERSLKHRREARQETAFDRVKDLCGIIKDGPADMSTNPKYMKDFGK